MPRKRGNKLKKVTDIRCKNGQTAEPKACEKKVNNGPQLRHGSDPLSSLSLEMLCHILQYLPLKDVMKLEFLNHKLHQTVSMHLQMINEIDFCQGDLHGWMPNFVDDTFNNFLERCREVVYIFGLHPKNISKRRQRGVSQLSIPGIIAGLQKCPKLDGVEISDVFLLEAVLKYLPYVEILGKFTNRDGTFPIPTTHRIILPRNPMITTLHLTGITLPELPRMVSLEHIHLRWVKFTDPHPFREFAVPTLQTFVMNNCAGPLNALKYVPLITGLAAAKSLTRMEFVRVPFLGGLIQHVVEDSWRVQGFRNLKKITMGTCKHVLEVDIGFLTITCCSRLEELAIQASLTKDSFFSSLTLAGVTFPKFETLHLGYEDAFPDKWCNENLLAFGLAEVAENPANITDNGLKSVGQVFTAIKSLSIYNCPHLLHPTSWFTEGRQTWQALKILHLRRCHAVRLYDFCAAIAFLPSLESLYLEQMFREPPKGCSRVGLSAGTGLGVSAALVSNTGNDVVNGDEERDDDENHEDLQADVDPMEGTSRQNNEKSGENTTPINADSDIDDEDAKKLTSSEAHMEPGVVETDGIFYSVPECDNESVTPDSHKFEGGVSHEENVDQSIRKGSSNQAIDGSSTIASPISNDDSMSLTSVICSASTSSIVTNNALQQGDNTNAESNSFRKEDICAGASTSKSGERVTIIERKVGNQSVFVVQKEATCSDSSHGHKHPPSVVVKGTSDIGKISEPDESGDPLLCRQSDGSTSNPRNDNHTKVNSPSKSTGKGKSLRGNKKGLVKSSKSSCVSSVKPETCKPTKGNSLATKKVTATKSCQAVSEEIRETTRRGSCSSGNMNDQADRPENIHDDQLSIPRVITGENTQSAATSPSQPAAGSPVVTASQSHTRSYRFGPMIGPIGEAIPESEDSPSSSASTCKDTAKKLKSKMSVATKDQSTSTSDPVIEEDHVQVLYIKSSSLINLTLHQVGITSLVLTSCPKLRSLSGTSCRVLKSVSIKRAPCLTKVNFAQCKKLVCTDVAKEVACLPGDRKRFVSLRPMIEHDCSKMEIALFKPPDHNYHICVVHDDSRNPSSTVYNRLRASTLMDFMDDFNLKVISDGLLSEGIRRNQASPVYPWGREIYRMRGRLHDGSNWDIVSDFPWLRDLSECDRIPLDAASKLPESVMFDGIYDPNSRGHSFCSQASDYLTDAQTIAEYIASGAILYNNYLVVYVSTCDTEGAPMEDRYI